MFVTKNNMKSFCFEKLQSYLFSIVIFSSLLIQLVSLEQSFLMRLILSIPWGAHSMSDIHSS